MPQAFNIGDRVRCVDNDGFKRLEVGKEYTVSDASLRFIYLDGDKRESCNGWYPRHFELVKPEPKFKAGDRVVVERDVFGLKAGDTSTILRPSLVTAQTENYGTDHEEYRVENPGGPYGFSLHYADDLKLAPEEPKFSVGQRVRTKLSIWCYGLDEGAVGVVRGLSDDPTSNFPYKVSFPEKGDGYVFLAESEIEPAPAQEFKLKPGDKVKNLKTGRRGVVIKGFNIPRSIYPNEPYVIDRDGPIKDRVPTRLLEEYEAQHPGTYDLVVGEPAPW